jgi:3-oxoacyl-[acyl-carrier-protein] synthase III
LHGLSTVLGEAKSLTDLAVPGREREISFLEGLGIKGYLQFPGTIPQLYEACIGAVLAESGWDPGAIDCVLFTTCGFFLNERRMRYEDFDQVLYRRGIRTAYSMGTNMSHCGNIAQALRIARSFVASGELANVMIINFDKVDSDDKRFMTANEALLSDGASGFILSREPSRIELTGVANHADRGYLDPGTDKLGLTQKNIAGARRVRELLLQARGDAGDFERVVLPNYNGMVLNLFRGQLGIPEDRLFHGGFRDRGHAYSTDLIVNCRELMKAASRDREFEILCLGFGLFRWGAFSLRIRT